jgi:hypothetical protein
MILLNAMCKIGLLAWLNDLQLVDMIYLKKDLTVLRINLNCCRVFLFAICPGRSFRASVDVLGRFCG